EHFLPAKPAAGDIVQLLFQLGGIIEIHIALEKALEERRYQAPALFRNEAVLFQPDIFAVLQRLERRGIGRRSADAELLQPLDETCLGKARRWLGEVLRRLDPGLDRRVARTKGGHPAAILVLAFVASFFVQST